MTVGIRFDARQGLKKVTRNLTALHRKQLPFATAMALTKVAKLVQAAEVDQLTKRLDKPTPFTLRAFAVRSATKSTLAAKVYARPKQAAYLAPDEVGGPQVIPTGAKSVITPINVALNAYDNLARTKVATLKAQPDVFEGPVKFKNGAIILGLWRRAPVGKRRGEDGKRRTGARGGKGKHSIVADNKTTLKLLVEFTAPKAIAPRLGYQVRAKQTVARCLAPEMRAALKQAVATARR